MAETFSTPDLVIAETGAYVAEQQAYLQLMRTAEVLGQQLSDLLEAHGLSGKQYNVLRAIRRGGPDGLPVSKIGEQMTDPRADITRFMDRLTRDGLVKRAHDREDRRVVRATLTAKGRHVLKEIDKPLIALHRRQFGHMTEKKLEALIALLKEARGEGRTS